MLRTIFTALMIASFTSSAFAEDSNVSKALKCIGKAYSKRNLSYELNAQAVKSLKAIHYSINSRTPLESEQMEEICEGVSYESDLAHKLSRSEAKSFRENSIEDQFGDNNNPFIDVLSSIMQNDVVECTLGGVEVSVAVFIGLGAGAKGGTCVKSTGRKYVAGGISLAGNWGIGIDASVEKTWLRNNYETQDDEKAGFILTSTQPLGQGGEDLTYHGDYGVRGAGLGYGFIQEKKKNIVPLLFPVGWDFEWIIRKLKDITYSKADLSFIKPKRAKANSSRSRN